MNKFKIHSKFKPMGDQPKAIDSLAQGIEEGQEFQTLLGLLVQERLIPWQIL